MEIVAHSELTGIAVVALAALLCGLMMERLRQPAFVGYIVAGVLLGPSGFALVENRDQIDTLADLGVLMLLFVVGMELSIRLFMRIWRLALSTTLIQIAASMVVMLLLSALTDWPIGMVVLLGFVVALSSTAAAIKMLQESRETKSRTGLISIAVLITQDLAFVPMILILGVISVGHAAYQGLLAVVGSMAILAALIWYLARGRRIRLPMAHLFSRSNELAPLTALAFCFGAATISGLLGMSPAYGAFLAGLVLGNSEQRPQLLRNAKPIQSILVMVFFLSVGLLLDLPFIWDNLGTVLLLLFLVTVFKTVMNTAILRFMGQPWAVAFMTSVILAQIGEFSFLLARTGLETGLIGEDVMRLVVAVTVLSLALSPLWLLTARRLHYLTAGGIESLGEMMSLVYGREAGMIADTVQQVGPKARLVGERLARLARPSKPHDAGNASKRGAGKPETAEPKAIADETKKGSSDS